MEQLTLKELATLNRLVKKRLTRHLLADSESTYFQRPDAECPSYIQMERKWIAELEDLNRKLDRMILETNY